MSRSLVALKRKPDIPRDVLAGAVVCVELFDRLTIDGDGIIARTRWTTCRNDKNVCDVRAIGRNVEACRTAVAVAGECLYAGRDRHRARGCRDGLTARLDIVVRTAGQD